MSQLLSRQQPGELRRVSLRAHKRQDFDDFTDVLPHLPVLPLLEPMPSTSSTSSEEHVTRCPLLCSAVLSFPSAFFLFVRCALRCVWYSVSDGMQCQMRATSVSRLKGIVHKNGAGSSRPGESPRRVVAVLDPIQFCNSRSISSDASCA